MSETETPASESRGCRVLLILAALVIVTLALLIGLQVIRVLYGIVMPPSPPLPSNSVEMSHSSLAYGVDRWQYHLPTDACSVVGFYEAQAGICQVARFQCGREGVDTLELGLVAQCVGETPFSIFNMRWAANIYPESAETVRLEVSRDVYWIGNGPTTTPQIYIDELSSSPNSTTAP